MNNLLLIGFSKDINIRINNLNTIYHSPFKLTEGGLSPKEYELLCKRIIENTSIVLINLDKRNLSFDEGFLLMKAYTNNVVIVGVGDKIRDSALHIVLSNKFKFIQDVVTHLKDNY